MLMLQMLLTDKDGIKANNAAPLTNLFWDQIIISIGPTSLQVLFFLKGTSKDTVDGMLS